MSVDPLLPDVQGVNFEMKASKDAEEVPLIVSEAVVTNFRRLASKTFATASGSSAFSRPSLKHPEYRFEEISLQSIIERKLATSENLDLLDIGCGSGKVLRVLQERFGSFLGIFGVDICPPSHLSEDLYALGNAERLLEIEALGKKQFDLIVSRGTFRHFIDPREAIIQTYEKLSPGGIMMIDMVVLPGLQNYEQSLIYVLNKRGFPTFASISEGRGTFSWFAIQKVSEARLQLPFIYAEKPVQWGNAQYFSTDLENNKAPEKQESFKEWIFRSIDS